MQLANDEIQRATVTETADAFIPDTNNNVLSYSQSYNVIVPRTHDFATISVKAVQKMNAICQEAQEAKFSLADLFLGLGTLFLGAFLGALTAGISLEPTLQFIFFYTVCPATGIGCIVAYSFSRNKQTDDIKQFSKRVAEILQEVDVDRKVD